MAVFIQRVITSLMHFFFPDLLREFSYLYIHILIFKIKISVIYFFQLEAILRNIHTYISPENFCNEMNSK